MKKLFHPFVISLVTVVVFVATGLVYQAWWIVMLVALGWAGIYVLILKLAGYKRGPNRRKKEEPETGIDHSRHD